MLRGLTQYTLADMRDAVRLIQFNGNKDVRLIEIARATERGYVTRKGRDDDQIPVYIAQGSRDGMLYILKPRFDTTRYVDRVYIAIEFVDQTGCSCMLDNISNYMLSDTLRAVKAYMEV